MNARTYAWVWLALAGGLLVHAQSGAKADAPSDEQSRQVLASLWRPSPATAIPIVSLAQWLSQSSKPDGRLVGIGVAPSAQRTAGGAIVEVWGDSDQEVLRQVKVKLLPELQAAFRQGWSCNVSNQICGEIMAMAASGKEVKAPTSPVVWYNCMMPTGYDPKLLPYASGLRP